MDDATFGLAIALAAATLRVAAPLVLAALGGLLSERAGLIDLGLEGKMLIAAFAAGAVAGVTGSVVPALAAALAASVALSLIHAYACVSHGGNQVVSGMALNILVAGLAPTLGHAWFGKGGQTPALAQSGRFLGLDLPGTAGIGQIPILGPIYAEVAGGHTLPVYLAALAVPAVAYLVYRTRFGLRLRAAGENPHAFDTAGVSVAWTRYRAQILCGLLCGLAGAFLSLALSAGFVRDMTAGKGYLALTALIFGKWKPVPTLLACLLFAFADALQTILQGMVFPVIGQIPVQFIQMLPYVLTVLLLAGFVGAAHPPRAIGEPFVKDR